jgi:bla regulator protein blaR1
MASAAFGIAGVFEAWRVSPRAAPHHLSIFGHAVRYPAANVAAVVVLVLAALGLVAIATAVVGAGREVRAARRFAHLMARSRLTRFQDAFVFPDERPRAFCAGLLSPRVYVSTGAVALLDERALGAVLAHERRHARRRDPLRTAAGRVLARSLFFVPGLGELVRREQLLAELSADESAVNAAPGNRSALARAMLGFSDSARPGEPTAVDPARADYVLGSPPSWRFPALLFVMAFSVTALLVATAVLAGQVAVGSATLSPPLLSRQPCIVVLALIPVALGLAAVRLGRALRPVGAPSYETS